MFWKGGSSCAKRKFVSHSPRVSRQRSQSVRGNQIENDWIWATTLSERHSTLFVLRSRTLCFITLHAVDTFFCFWSSFLHFTPILSIEKVYKVVLKQLDEKFSAEISVLKSLSPKNWIKKRLYVKMLISLCQPKASAKVAGPILLRLRFQKSWLSARLFAREVVLGNVKNRPQCFQKISPFSIK